MKLPSKEYYRLPEIARHWKCEVEDLLYYARQGMLKLSINVLGVGAEVIKMTEEVSAGKEGEVSKVEIKTTIVGEPEYLQGLYVVPVHYIDYLKDDEALYVRLPHPTHEYATYRPHVSTNKMVPSAVKLKDIVITASEKKRFEDSCNVAVTDMPNPRKIKNLQRIIRLLIDKMAEVTVTVEGNDEMDKFELRKSSGSLNVLRISEMLKALANKSEFDDDVKGIGKGPVGEIIKATDF
ncbi:MAG: hypothetical protein MUO63_09935 [Desulfobulbaceae bacterium]|nr:hypothetical protein [Desulfobulbaceae bacterium]